MAKKTIRGLHAATKARNEMLADWLFSGLHAQCMWQQEVKRVGLLECWSANGRVFMVMRYEGDAGWEVYIPASASNSSKDTLASASKYIRGEV